MEPRETPDRATAKQIPYADMEGKLYEMGRKITAICKETQAEETAAQTAGQAAVTIKIRASQ